MALDGLFCVDVPLRNYSLTHQATDVTVRRSLHSSSSTAVIIPVTRCNTIRDHALLVAAAHACRQSFVMISSSLLTFKNHLKMYLFATSY